MYIIIIFAIGLQEIQGWVKQSLREKPFSVAKGKIWTERPSKIPLKDIYTNLRVVKKERKTSGTESTELPDLMEMLREPFEHIAGPIRILATGTALSLLNHS